jgi:hypothetical protein
MPRSDGLNNQQFNVSFLIAQCLFLHDQRETSVRMMVKGCIRKTAAFSLRNNSRARTEWQGMSGFLLLLNTNTRFIVYSILGYPSV